MPLLTPLPTIGTLSAAVPTNAPSGISSLAVSAPGLTQPVKQGDELVLVGGGETQSGIYASAAAAVGSTSVATVPFQPGYGGFPVGTTVADATTGSDAEETEEFDVAGAAVSAGVATTFVIGVVPSSTDSVDFLGSLVFTPNTAQAAEGGTNFATATFRQLRAGAVQQANLASINFGTTATVAETPISAPLTDPAPFTLQAGDIIDVVITHTGTGGAVPAGNWSVQEA